MRVWRHRCVGCNWEIFVDLDEARPAAEQLLELCVLYGVPPLCFWCQCRPENDR
jgi:hypothetical protein